MFRHRLCSLPLLACAGALAAAPVLAQTRITQGDRLISYRLAPAADGDEVRASFQVELRDRNLLDPTGGRSMAGEAALNCAAGLSRLESMTVYAQPGRSGAVVRRAERQTAWVRPEMGSLVRAVMISACKTPAATSAGPPRPNFASSASANILNPQPGPYSTAAVQPPAPAAASVQKPAPVAPPAPVSAPTAPGEGAFRVQVGSFPSVNEAETHAARVRRGAPQLSAPRLEAARVSGTTYHRVMIDGFGSRADAEGACRAMRAQDIPCLVKSAPRGGR